MLGLRNEADDHGIFEWRPLSLKLRILPLDDLDVDELLAELAGRGLIASYDVDGERYGVCLSWHQQPQHPSYRYPQPPVDKAPEPSVSAQEEDYKAPEPSVSAHPDSYLESESESKKREGAPAPAGAALSLDFDLPDEWQEEARAARRSVSLGDVNLAAEWVKFRHHHAGKKRRDWRRRWLNWALNARAASASAAPADDADPPAGSAEPEATARRDTPPDWQHYPLKWRSAARRFVDGVWWPGDGPMPGEAGCQMPGELTAWCIEQRALSAEPAKVANTAPVKPRRHRPPDPAQPAMKLPIAGGKAAAEPEAVKHKPKPGDRDPRTTPPPGKPWPGDSWEGRPPAREVG